MASVTPIKELRRKADGEPRQETFWDVEIYWDDLRRWCYSVQVRSRFAYNPLCGIGGEWTDWVPDWEKPSHFRKEADAQSRLLIRLHEERKKIELGILEMQVLPKYLACIPGEDETWIV